MPSEGIDINSLYNRIEWLTKDVEKAIYRNIEKLHLITFIIDFNI